MKKRVYFCPLQGEYEMKVLLTADVKGTGKKGEVHEVSDGYARNMLIKKGLAKEATAVEINSLKIKNEAQEFHRKEEEKRLRELAQRLNKNVIVCKVKAGEKGRSKASFIGLGINAPMPSLGSLANDALNGINTYGYRLVIPAVVISLIVLSLNLFGDGLRDAFDPKLNN